MINYKKFTEKSIDFLAEYIKTNNLKSLVLGISGGIDSTVTAVIASEACKKTNTKLIGRSLSTKTNSSSEINAATLVGEAFCDNFKEVSIEYMYDEVAYEIRMNEENMSPLQEGNIKARLRMIYLYNLASIHRSCVLDTDNKTEHELGFWTIHGDVGDLNCGIINLWKTEVYGLANYLLEQYNIEWKAFDDFEDSEVSHKADIACVRYKALKASINLIPTDGNGVMSGGDCAQFGLDNYEQVDDVLKTMYFKAGMDSSEYTRLIDSYNEQGVDKVMILHQNTRYKRKELPIKPTKEELGL